MSKVDIQPLPPILANSYQKDSLIYSTDSLCYYNVDFDKALLEDIKNKRFQIYNATYRYDPNNHHTIIFLSGRGKTCGKKIFTVEGFYPYCYIKNENGESRTYLREKVSKVLFETEPRIVADLRRSCEKLKKDIPKEADIPFCIKGDTLINYGDKYKRVDECNIGDTILSCNEKTLNQSYATITNIKTKQVDKYYRITTQNGTIECDGEHKIPVLDENGNIIIKLAKKISKYDFLLTTEFLGDSGKGFSFDNKFDDDIFEFFGYYIGDGTRIKNNSLCIKDKNYHNILYYSEILRKYIKTKSIPKESKGENSYKFEITNKYLATLFKKYNLNLLSKDIYIPEVIMKEAGTWQITNILKGLYDAEGSVSKDNITFTSISKKLILQIQLLLKRLGIISHLYSDKNTKSGNPIYIIQINEKRSIRRFKDNIGFNDINKLKKLEDIRQNEWCNYKNYPDEIKEIEDILYRKNIIPLKIKEIEIINRDTKLYDISLDVDFMFYGNNIIIHNCRRFLIDMYDYFKPESYIEPKIAILDIETDYPVNKNRIISFALNGYDGELYFNSLDYDGSYSLVLDLYSKITEYDIISNWNVEFDINVLQTNIDKYKMAFKPLMDGLSLSKEEYVKALTVDYNLFGMNGSNEIVDALIFYGFLKEDNDIIKYGDKKLYTDLNFILTPIDLLPISKKMYAKEIAGRWSLDNVGAKIVGLNKYPIEEKYIRDLDKETLLQYNVRDVIIPEIIDNTLGGLLAHVIMAWSLQQKITDMIMTAVVNDIALLREYHHNGVVLNSRPAFKLSDEEETYKAAEPDARPGVYNNIVAGDLKHAYPSAVIAINASSETKDPNGKYLAPNGVRFNEDKSIFINTLKELMVERGRVKKKMKEYPKNSSEWRMYKFIDFALKTQAAAFSHGIFGWENSRMKDIPVADAITATVRGILDVIKAKVDELGYPWVYVHTDSCYFQLGERNNSKDMNHIMDILNDTIKEYCVSQGYSMIPELEYKGFYPKTYIHSAARNVLIDEEGDWHTTGMNFMRSEVPPVLAEIEKELIASKINGEDNESLINKLRKLIENLKEVDSRDLGLIKPLTKSIKKYGRIGKDGFKVGIPYHIRAIENAKNDYGFKIKIGEKFMILPVMKLFNTDKQDYVAFNIDEGLPEFYEIDFDTYLKGNLFGKVNKLFDLKPKELRDRVYNVCENVE